MKTYQEMTPAERTAYRIQEMETKVASDSAAFHIPVQRIQKLVAEVRVAHKVNSLLNEFISVLPVTERAAFVHFVSAWAAVIL